MNENLYVANLRNQTLQKNNIKLPERVSYEAKMLQVLQFVELSLLFTSWQMSSFNRIRARSHRGNNTQTMTSVCGQTHQHSAFSPQHTNTSFALQVGEKNPQTIAVCRQGLWNFIAHKTVLWVSLLLPKNLQAPYGLPVFVKLSMMRPSLIR